MAVRQFPQYITVRGKQPITLIYYERHKEPEALLRGAVKVMEQVVTKFEETAASGDASGDAVP